MTIVSRFAAAAALALLLIGGMAHAQGASVAFGGLKHDASLPVEITADELTVDQTTGSAVFSGNVVAGQGEMRLSASRVQVQYATENGEATGRIDQLIATGSVTLVNGAEAAEAEKAVYSVDAANIVMTGNVILTQGVNALSGEKLTVDLNTGSGRMSGRVRTIFRTGGN
ncbi:lipopolysaccharide transport periplasmic protein LptA [Litoreibacter albidus]|uniref:Lipopolysaccharide export system protein LptA n=1 Tax=Litoreibacter albidus TaxID=670155 RepID=A0A1H2WAN5_9RHOB|nr:lipopolysaccharide transport periplasmic protein LptA [Litoreibacter albidus]SDW77334.1 lipopolysaccharide export system protein LptA [Litoreibacter albidus]